MLTNRASGILLHPTSLPGPFGSGDFGTDAYRYVDWLHSAGQTYWQMLPLGGLGPGNSPYMSSSAFAGNPLLIDLAELIGQGWLQDEDLMPLPDFQAERIDFSLLYPFRMAKLRQAACNFFASLKESNHAAAYAEFCHSEEIWLEDYALFMTLNVRYNGREWNLWPEELVSRNPQALHDAVNENIAEIGFWKFCQWCFSRQWSQLKEYAIEREIRIIGDVPIFVAYQSADVWAHQDLFELDGNGKPSVVAGVPPDYFSETGQLWGNPLYRWQNHEDSGYAWWVDRMRHALKLFDFVRIDHFRGFASYWEVPASATTAIDGQWVPGPGSKLFEAFNKALGGLPIIAEDLGVITPDVVELREKFNLPGMRILQFAFGGDETHYFLPHNYIPNSVAYTGTHDNDTSVGWWNSLSSGEKDFAKSYLDTDGQDIHWIMIKAISASNSNTVIFPMQDVLGLNGDNRMNFPGRQQGSWEWRFTWDQVNPGYKKTLANISSETSRTP